MGVAMSASRSSSARCRSRSAIVAVSVESSAGRIIDLSTMQPTGVCDLLTIRRNDNSIDQGAHLRYFNRPRHERYPAKLTQILAWDTLAPATGGYDCHNGPVLDHGSVTLRLNSGSAGTLYSGTTIRLQPLLPIPDGTLYSAAAPSSASSDVYARPPTARFNSSRYRPSKLV